MCPCCWDQAWGQRRVAAGPPWAWAGGPWQGEAGPRPAGPWWGTRTRREGLEATKRELEEHLAEVNEELARQSDER